MRVGDGDPMLGECVTEVERVFNFGAGPAVLPLPVLEEAQRDLTALPGVGMSVMEISHRSKAFEDILNTAIADIRTLGSVPPNYTILMLQGGASLQFSLVPMNLLGEGRTADYIDTGYFSSKAIADARSPRAERREVTAAPARAHRSRTLISVLPKCA